MQQTYHWSPLIYIVEQSYWYLHCSIEISIGWFVLLFTSIKESQWCIVVMCWHEYHLIHSAIKIKESQRHVDRIIQILLMQTTCSRGVSITWGISAIYTFVVSDRCEAWLIHVWEGGLFSIRHMKLLWSHIRAKEGRHKKVLYLKGLYTEYTQVSDITFSTSRKFLLILYHFHVISINLRCLQERPIDAQTLGRIFSWKGFAKSAKVSNALNKITA